MRAALNRHVLSSSPDVERVAKIAAAAAWMRILVALGFSLGVARWYGAEERGTVSYLVATTAVIVQLGDLGIPTALRITMTDIDSDIIRPYNYLFFRNGLCVLAIGAIVLVFTAETALPTAILAGVVLAQLTMEVTVRFVSGALNAIGLFVLSQSLQLFAVTFQFATLCVFFVSVDRSDGLALLALGVGSAMASVVALLVYWQLGLGGVTRTREIEAELSFIGRRSHLANSSIAVLLRSDQIAIGLLGGPTLLGRYAVAVSIAEALRPRTQSASQVVFRLAAEGSDFLKTRTSLLRSTVKFQLLLFVPVLAGAELFVPVLFGPEFDGMTVAILLLLLAEICFAVLLFSVRELLGRGVPNLATTVGLSAAAIGVVLNLLLIPRYGLHGAVTATLLSYACGSIIGIWKRGEVNVSV